ncbi:6308_t:CDS:2 [Entrophospora sp. SA101]|nr:6308_t:CDS:2 [Entrophospora sp. SA101]
MFISLLYWAAIPGFYVLAYLQNPIFPWADFLEKSEKAPKKYNTGRFPIDDDDDEYEFSYSEDNHFIK